MKINITGLDAVAAPMMPAPDGTYSNIGSQGGTEMMAAKINSLDPALLSNFNIIHSRVRKDSIRADKKNILVLHDTWDDPESQKLSDSKFRTQFAKLVFVSNYQQATYNIGLGIPYSEGVVIQNAIEPIPEHTKPSGTIRLIYHTTPHRGLELLVPVFEKLCQDIPDIRLDVYSSFKMYGWALRDKEFQHLFDRLNSHPNAMYHGFKPNAVIREALQQAHIYAYPNIWPETSCISVIEAMSAGCEVVCSSFGALPETCANFAMMYPFHENNNVHANVFINVLASTIKNYHTAANANKRKFQKVYFDNYYDWDYRADQWTHFLRSLIS